MNKRKFDKDIRDMNDKEIDSLYDESSTTTLLISILDELQRIRRDHH